MRGQNWSVVGVQKCRVGGGEGGVGMDRRCSGFLSHQSLKWEGNLKLQGHIFQ